MGEVPQGWGIKAIGKLFPQIYRYPTYYNIEYVDSGIPELRGELLQDDGNITEDRELLRFISPKTSRKFGKTILKEGDIILSIRGTMGKVGYVTKALENSNITANLIRMSPDRKQIDPLFAKQVLISVYFKEQIELISSQTTIKTIKAPELKGILISTPTVPEQSEIAEILSDTDEAIEKTDRRIQKLKRIKQGLMQDLFRYGIDENGQLRSEATHHFKDSPLGRVPGEWEIASLATIGKIVTGTTPSTKKPEYYNGTYMFVSPKDIGDGVYINGTEKTISERGLKVSRWIPRDSICVVCIGSTIGKIGISTSKCATNQQINTIIPSPSNNYLIIYYLCNFYLLNQLRVEAGLQAVPIVNKEGFSRLLIPRIGAYEQSSIASILSRADEAIEKEEAYKQKLLAIKRGLMEGLLSGKMRVNNLITQN